MLAVSTRSGVESGVEGLAGGRGWGVQYLSPGREVAALGGRGWAGILKLQTNTRVATMNGD